MPIYTLPLRIARNVATNCAGNDRPCFDRCRVARRYVGIASDMPSPPDTDGWATAGLVGDSPLRHRRFATGTRGHPHRLRSKNVAARVEQELSCLTPT